MTRSSTCANRGINMARPSPNASGTTGKLRAEIPPAVSVAETIAFVQRQLADWRDDPNRPEEDSEDKLNLQLCDFLDTQARAKYPMVRFTHQEPQTGRRKVDLAAKPTEQALIGARPHTIYDPILVLEGKRLPSPARDRMREYVTGFPKRSGGIQRFKLGEHGSALDAAVMVGYVQAKTSDHWWSEINGWILELADETSQDYCKWGHSEQLGTLNKDQNRTASCESKHGREPNCNSTEIRLLHLWVEMSRAKTP